MQVDAIVPLHDTATHWGNAKSKECLPSKRRRGDSSDVSNIEVSAPSKKQAIESDESVQDLSLK